MLTSRHRVRPLSQLLSIAFRQLRSSLAALLALTSTGEVVSPTAIAVPLDGITDDHRGRDNPALTTDAHVVAEESLHMSDTSDGITAAKKPTTSPSTTATRINKRKAHGRGRTQPKPVVTHPNKWYGTQRETPLLLAIAASTSGSSALQTILLGLRAGFPLPTLVAQHIAYGFVEGMVAWLNRTTPLPVCVARPEEYLLPGHVYLAPDGQHLLAGEGGVARLRPGASGDRYCPSAERKIKHRGS